jgi:hypothetical protein
MLVLTVLFAVATLAVKSADPVHMAIDHNIVSTVNRIPGNT